MKKFQDKRLMWMYLKQWIADRLRIRYHGTEGLYFHVWHFFNEYGLAHWFGEVTEIKQYIKWTDN